jgi:hypothetical protein
VSIVRVCEDPAGSRRSCAAAALVYRSSRPQRPYECSRHARCRADLSAAPNLPAAPQARTTRRAAYAQAPLYASICQGATSEAPASLACCAQLQALPKVVPVVAEQIQTVRQFRRDDSKDTGASNREGRSPVLGASGFSNYSLPARPLPRLGQSSSRGETSARDTVCGYVFVNHAIELLSCPLS